MFINRSFGLREMTESDLEQVLRWRNTERIRQCMYTDQLIGWDDHVAWFHRAKQSEQSKHLLFELRGEPVGVMNFTQIDRIHDKCYWGFYVGNEHAPKGTGTLLGYSGLQYAFETLGIRKLCAEAFSFNTKSIDFHGRMGFRQEGVLRAHFRKKDTYHDIHCFAMFREEWTHHSERLSAIIQNLGV